MIFRCYILWAFFGIVIGSQAQVTDSSKASVKVFRHPVAPFGDTLFFVYENIGPISAEEVASMSKERILELADNDFLNTDSIKLKEGEDHWELVIGKTILSSISLEDVRREKKEAREIALHRIKLIQEAVEKTRDQHSWTRTAGRVGLVVSILLVFGILVRFIDLSFRKLRTRILRKEWAFLKGIKISNYKLVTQHWQIALYIKISQIVEGLVILFLLYLTMPILFSLFPFTKGWTNTLLSWVWIPFNHILNSVWAYLPNLFTIAVIFFVTRFVVKILRFAAHEVESGRLTVPHFYKEWAMPTFNIARFLLYVLMFVAIFPYIPGSHSPVFQGVSVFLGLLLSLGSSSVISNIFSGLVVTYMRPFTVGDYVKISNHVGEVIERSLLVTRIRTVKNEDITIPNSSVLSGSTINYSSSVQSTGLILYTSVTIGYDVPWQKMHAAMIKAALRTQWVLQDPKPFVLQTSLNDYNVAYQLNVYTREAAKQNTIYSELHQHLQDVCFEEGIEILSPAFTAIRDGNHVAMPADYLPKGYQAPGFKME